MPKVKMEFNGNTYEGKLSENEDGSKTFEYKDETGAIVERFVYDKVVEVQVGKGDDKALKAAEAEIDKLKKELEEAKKVATPESQK